MAEDAVHGVRAEEGGGDGRCDAGAEVLKLVLQLAAERGQWIGRGGMNVWY